jgi:hypothetical protein
MPADARPSRAIAIDAHVEHVVASRDESNAEEGGREAACGVIRVEREGDAFEFECDLKGARALDGALEAAAKRIEALREGSANEERTRG